MMGALARLHRGRALRGALVIIALLTPACGQPDDSPDDPDQAMAVDPDAAMDTTPAGTPAPPSPETIASERERTVSVRLLEWAVETSRDTVPAGEISFEVMNTGSMHHALEVEGGGVEEETEQIEPGGVATLTLRLDPGTYELYCPIVDQYDHAEQGMRTELVVQSNDGSLLTPGSS